MQPLQNENEQIDSKRHDTQGSVLFKSPAFVYIHSVSPSQVRCDQCFDGSLLSSLYIKCRHSFYFYSWQNQQHSRVLLLLLQVQVPLRHNGPDLIALHPFESFIKRCYAPGLPFANNQFLLHWVTQVLFACIKFYQVNTC